MHEHKTYLSFSSWPANCEPNKMNSRMQRLPMETAPRDGTPILVLDDDGEFIVVSWNGTGWLCVAYDMTGANNPVGWCHLPDWD